MTGSVDSGLFTRWSLA